MCGERGCGLQKNGGEGVTLSKTHQFGLICRLVVILVNFLYFALIFLGICFRCAAGGGGGGEVSDWRGIAARG